MRKTKQEIQKEILEVQLEKNRLDAELNVLKDDTRQLYEAIGEANGRKKEIEKTIEALEAETSEVAKKYGDLIDDVRNGMRASHDLAQNAIQTVYTISGVISTMLGDLNVMREEKQALEKEIIARREATKVVLKDLDVYADRLTKAYEMNMPNQKVVIGSKKAQEIDLSKITIWPSLPQE